MGPLGHTRCGPRPDLFAGIVALDPVLVPTRIWAWSVLINRLMPDAMPIVSAHWRGLTSLMMWTQPCILSRQARVFRHIG